MYFKGENVMWRWFASLACGVALGIVVDRIVLHFKSNQEMKYSKVLEKCFGDPMYTNTFAISDVRDWSKAREEQLKEGHKIVVLKAIPELLKELGKDLEIGNGLDDYLVMALVNEEKKEIVESLLVKCEQIDTLLEEQLKKGGGFMVVGA